MEEVPQLTHPATQGCSVVYNLFFVFGFALPLTHQTKSLFPLGLRKRAAGNGLGNAGCKCSQCFVSASDPATFGSFGWWLVPAVWVPHLLLDPAQVEAQDHTFLGQCLHKSTRPTIESRGSCQSGCYTEAVPRLYWCFGIRRSCPGFGACSKWQLTCTAERAVRQV